jgi:hypothetical protein
LHRYSLRLLPSRPLSSRLMLAHAPFPSVQKWKAEMAPIPSVALPHSSSGGGRQKMTGF